MRWCGSRGGSAGHADPAARLRYLPRMLGDPVRAVRIEAARALAELPAERARPSAERRSNARWTNTSPRNATTPTGPRDAPTLANLYALRGNAEAAEVEYRKSIELDPTFVPAYANLADLYRARGVDSEAEKVLRSGLAKAPNAAALHHAMGLVFVRQKRYADALKELTEAARLDAANARYAYVQAVALNDSGQPAQALKVLQAALKRQPHDRELLSTLAIYTARAGDREAALGYVKQLRELDPDNPAHAQLGRQIEGSALTQWVMHGPWKSPGRRRVGAGC